MSELKTFQANMGKPIRKKRFSNFSLRNSWDTIAGGAFVFVTLGFLGAGLIFANDNEDVGLKATIVCGQGAEGKISAFDLTTGEKLNTAFLKSSFELSSDAPIDATGMCQTNGQSGFILPLENVRNHIKYKNGS